MRYTFDDIITAKDIVTGKIKKEDIIGKVGYFTDKIPGEMKEVEHLPKGMLEDVEAQAIWPFRRKDVPFEYLFFIPEKEESAQEPRFKVGDRVKILEEWIGFGAGCSPTAGGMGTVECVHTDDVKVRLDSDADYWWYRTDDVELIEDKPAYTEADIISDPHDPRLEEAIGKQVYYGDEVPKVLRKALYDNSEGELTAIDPDWSHPFLINDSLHWKFIIIKKGQPQPARNVYEARQAKWVKANGIKVGDKVRILRYFEPYEDGFCSCNNSKMKDLVGEVLTVKGVKKSVIAIWNKDHSDWWSWPYFVLEKVDEPAYVPFDLSKPEDRDALRNSWIKDRRSGNEWVIAGFYKEHSVKDAGEVWRAKLPKKNGGYTAEELFERSTFLDGSVVGKPANTQQIK